MHQETRKSALVLARQKRVQRRKRLDLVQVEPLGQREAQLALHSIHPQRQSAVRHRVALHLRARLGTAPRRHGATRTQRRQPRLEQLLQLVRHTVPLALKALIQFVPCTASASARVANVHERVGRARSHGLGGAMAVSEEFGDQDRAVIGPPTRYTLHQGLGGRMYDRSGGSASGWSCIGSESCAGGSCCACS